MQNPEHTVTLSLSEYAAILRAVSLHPEALDTIIDTTVRGLSLRQVLILLGDDLRGHKEAREALRTAARGVIDTK